MTESLFFNDDSALNVRDDYLEELVKTIEQEIDDAGPSSSSSSLCLGEVDYIMAYFEILYGIALYCGNNTYSKKDVNRWSASVLRIFDRAKEAGEVENMESFLQWRQKVVDSFERLSNLAVDSRN